MVLQALFSKEPGWVRQGATFISCLYSITLSCLTFKDHQAWHRGCTSPTGLQSAWELTPKPCWLQVLVLKHAWQCVLHVPDSSMLSDTEPFRWPVCIYLASLCKSHSLLTGEGRSQRALRHQEKSDPKKALGNGESRGRLASAACLGQAG